MTFSMVGDSIRLGPHAHNFCGLSCDKILPLLKFQQAPPGSNPSLTTAEPNLTTAELTFSITNYSANFVLLSVPFVFMQVGYLVGVVFVVIVASLCTITASMLGATLEKLVKDGVERPTFGDVALAAGGPRCGALMQTSCLMELGAYFIGNGVVFGQTVGNQIGGFNNALAFCVIVGVLLSGIPDKAYSYAMLCAVSVIVSSAALVDVSGFKLPEWAEGDGMIGPIVEFPRCFCILVFGGAVHPCLPTIFNSAGTRRKYEKAAHIAWCFWGGFAVVFGSLTYYIYGSSVQVISARNIGHDIYMEEFPPTRGFERLSAFWIATKILLSNPPCARPIVDWYSHKLGIKLRPGGGGIKKCFLSIPVVVALGASSWLLQNHVATMEAVTGCLLQSLNGFIFPAAAYVQVCRPSSVWLERLGVGIALFGVAFSVVYAVTCLSS